MNSKQLRLEIQHSDLGDMRRRRYIAAASLAGLASMVPVTLLQMGLVKHLPDPPIRGFDSDKVNQSGSAYAMGLPDGTLALASFAANIPLAATGGIGRPQTQPWLPLLAMAKAGAEAAVSGWFFYQMPKKEKAWCAYCICGAAASAVIFALTMPEAVKALRSVWVAAK